MRRETNCRKPTWEAHAHGTVPLEAMLARHGVSHLLGPTDEAVPRTARKGAPKRRRASSQSTAKKLRGVLQNLIDRLKRSCSALSMSLTGFAPREVLEDPLTYRRPGSVVTGVDVVP